MCLKRYFRVNELRCAVAAEIVIIFTHFSGKPTVVYSVTPRFFNVMHILQYPRYFAICYSILKYSTLIEEEQIIKWYTSGRTDYTVPKNITERP